LDFYFPIPYNEYKLNPGTMPQTRAAHLDYYVAEFAQPNFLAMGDTPAIHHYAWLNKENPHCNR
jgi:hypothetical protein